MNRLAIFKKIERYYLFVSAIISGIVYSCLDIILRASCMGAIFTNEKFLNPICVKFSTFARTKYYDGNEERVLVRLSYDYAIIILLFFLFVGIFVFRNNKDQFQKKIEMLRYFAFSFILTLVTVGSIDFISSTLANETQALKAWKIDCKKQVISTPVYSRNFQGEKIKACDEVGRGYGDVIDIFRREIK